MVTPQVWDWWQKINLQNFHEANYNCIIFLAQNRYLSFLEFTNDTATSGTLPPCQNCTVAINIPGNGFPFGSYYHSTVYVRQNPVTLQEQFFYYINFAFLHTIRLVQMEFSPLVEISIRIYLKPSLQLMLKSTLLISQLPIGPILTRAWTVK